MQLASLASRFRSPAPLGALGLLLLPSVARAHDPAAGILTVFAVIAAAALVVAPFKRVVRDPEDDLAPAWWRLLVVAGAESLLAAATFAASFSSGAKGFAAGAAGYLVVVAALHRVLLRAQVRSWRVALALCLPMPALSFLLGLVLGTTIYAALD